MIPEIQSLNDRPSVIRIPHQIDVPVTDRIRHLLDTDSFQRLSRVSQLGLVALVYPGATHSRFEHSLGVFRNALLFAHRLIQFDSFRSMVDSASMEALVVAALLHDLGHWPYCHPIEDISIEGIPEHEDLIESIIVDGEIGKLLERDWSLDIGQLTRLIRGNANNDVERLLCSILSGPIDIDKMDYLYRDSLHCGVPYGMNFDAPRLINSITINRDKNGIAISSKAKTAAEMMVFARYVMFSEVYWHHAVRSATAMLQRIFYLWYQENAAVCTPAWLTGLDDLTFAQSISAAPCPALFDGLLGKSRRLYKRLLDYNADQNSDVFHRLAHQPYQRLIQIGETLSKEIVASAGIEIQAHEILVDAPPPGLEVQFEVEVNDSNVNDSLENMSPVVKALAKQQFDHVV